MPRSVADKALEAIAARRVRVVKANGRGIALRVTGSPDPDTNRERVYTAALYVDENGALCRSCTCANADAHPIVPKCHHVRCAELLWRPAERRAR